MKKLIAFKVLIVVILSSLYANAEEIVIPNYTVLDLGTLNGKYIKSFAAAINEHNQVVGFGSWYDETGRFRWSAWVWDIDNGMRELEELGGSETQAYDINDLGQIVGYSYDTSGQDHALIWDNNNFTDIGYGRAYGINNFTEVVGYYYIWDKLNGRQSTSCRLLSINDVGIATGFIPLEYATPLYWDNTLGNQPIFVPQGYRGGSAVKINNLNQIVGNLWTDTRPSPHHAYLANNVNDIIILGTLGGSHSYANGINNSAIVVGQSSVIGSRYGRAFIWDQCNGMQNLNDLVISLDNFLYLSNAMDINDKGFIVGYGHLNVDEDIVHPVLLTPLPSSLIDIIAPNGGETLYPNTPYEISWSSEGSINNVKIEYLSTNGIDWITVIESTENDGLYEWNPPCALSNELLIMISDTDSETTDQSDEYFSIIDNTPPSIEVSVSPDILWPPNHKMVAITPIVIATDNCDTEPLIILKSISMNEGEQSNTFDPDYDATLSDGHTIEDIHIDANGSIFLRAERSGTGTGRIYTLIYEAVDSSGNTSTATATVTVPHNM